MLETVFFKKKGSKMLWV